MSDIPNSLKWEHRIPESQSSASQQRLSELYGNAEKFLFSLSEHENAAPPFVRYLLDKDSHAELAIWSNRVRKNCKHLVILGTGGSSRGGHAIYALRKRRNLTATEPKALFFENVGVHSMDNLIADLDPLTTHYLVISKSGNTAETLAQCLICIDVFKSNNLSDIIADHFTVIVGDNDNPLTKLAKLYNFHVFDHPEEVGGRYSALSVVGIAPALAAGIDTLKLLDSAKKAYSEILDPNISANKKQAVIGAVNQAFLNKYHFINQAILMPYDTRFVPFSRWHQQLWAESLGKDGKGTSPSVALGPVDQHSLLQLYLQGPRDKYFTLITEDTNGRGPDINEATSQAIGIEYLGGRRIGDLINAEAKATIEVLTQSDRPLRVISCSRVDENALGQLFAHLMMETVIMAHLIGVDPYDQPAVQKGKRLTRSYLENPDQS